MTLRGVFTAESEPGVFQAFCAGLGVMFTKSEKSKPWPGVCGNIFPPPGVVMCDEGRPKSRLFLGGGVEGGSMRVRVEGTAGEGDAARYSKRSAPSSPVFPPWVGFSVLIWWPGSPLLRMGGVIGGGGEDRT